MSLPSNSQYSHIYIDASLDVDVDVDVYLDGGIENNWKTIFNFSHFLIALMYHVHYYLIRDMFPFNYWHF